MSLRRGAWRRLGPIASFAGAAPWAVTHTALPVLLPRKNDPDGWDLYASTRDAEGRSGIGRARFLISPEPHVVSGTVEPILMPGELGTFDDRGVTVSCVIRHDGTSYLYYTGWMLGVTVPFYFAVGLAVSDDGRTFRRLSQAPILERSAIDPFLTASPCVRIEDGRWRMWYVSGTGWTAGDATPQHRYHIKYAESANGVDWTRHPHACIDYASPDEYAFGRPCVLYEHGLYRMWYSYRGERYRIGYAESKDGIQWERRDDHRGLAPSGAGWDADMVEYPWIVDQGERTYMLYNGNDYGRTGVGMAVWEPDAAERAGA